jgi:hypothetical protein
VYGTLRAGPALTFLLCLSGCQSDGIGGTSPAPVDAAPAPKIDAMPAGARDGIACQVLVDDATGGCAEGYACISIASAPSRCRQECPTLQTACAGYSGPGYSLCALTNTNGDGQAVGNLCLVICGDVNNTLNGCESGACNGECPGAWTCENDANNFGLKSCQ